MTLDELVPALVGVSVKHGGHTEVRTLSACCAAPINSVCVVRDEHSGNFYVYLNEAPPVQSTAH